MYVLHMTMALLRVNKFNKPRCSTIIIKDLKDDNYIDKEIDIIILNIKKSPHHNYNNNKP